MEMRLIVAKLLFHFDIRTTDHAALWTPEGDYKHCEAYTSKFNFHTESNLLPILLKDERMKAKQSPLS